jgi:hypothetical protein
LGCWAAAVICIAAGFFAPLLLVGRVVDSAMNNALGGTHHDLSDIGLSLLAVGVATIAGVAAGIVGSLLASFPALALIGKSGVFNRLRLRRRSKEVEHQEAWPFSS